MDTINFELTKIRKYELKPFGKFIFKWVTPKRDIPHVIGVNELQIKHDTSMPIPPDEDKEIIKFMKKHKTDVLTDGNTFFTRAGNGFVEVYHKKLGRYMYDEEFKNIIDNR